MLSKRRPSLNTTIGVALLLLLFSLGLIFLNYQRISEKAVEQVAEARIQQTNWTCAAQISQYLKDAEQSLTGLRTNLTRSQLAWSESNIENELRRLMIYRPGLGETSVIFPKSRTLLQLSVLRAGDQLVGVKIERQGSAVLEFRGSIDQNPKTWKRFKPDPPDPTRHPTVRIFEDAEQEDVWTDIHYNPFDSALPEKQRRIAVSFQGSCRRPAEKQFAVIRVGLEVQDVAKDLVKIRPEGHEVLLCDFKGRPLIRPDALAKQADNFFEEDDDDLRLRKDLLTPAWVAALAAVGANQGENKGKLPSFRVRSNRTDYWGGAWPVQGGQDWTVVSLVPESFYLGPLRTTHRDLLITWCVLILLVGAGGISLQIFLRSDLVATEVQIAEMEDFQFAPGSPSGHFKETQRVLEAMEVAKTSLRGFSKYAPLNLVRLLHHLKAEPELGGTLRVATILFTDIAGFTSLSESLEPNQLAQMLGMYLEVVADCIDADGGVVDKFIGDAAMALWNVPAQLNDHPVRACAAAWKILQKTAQLAQHPDWGGQPSWQTRIGIHTDEVMVGHFGSPKRMNYTALGDGVNISSRLESLNKLYGSHILVSQAIYEKAHRHFVFCRLDRVAVAGKTLPVDVYELVGAPDTVSAAYLAEINLYERALKEYIASDFSAALDTLQDLTLIGAAKLLRERCVKLGSGPVPEGWDGVFRLQRK